MNQKGRKARPGGPRWERQRLRRQEYKEMIVHAAEAVILRRGYQAATMDDIARQAQFSKATLYKYFRTKGEIVLEILLHFFDDIEREMDRILHENLDPREKLHQAIRSILTFYGEKENISRVILLEKSMARVLRLFMTAAARQASSEDRKFLALLKARRKRAVEKAAAILTEGIQAGVFRPFDVSEAIVFIDAVLQGMAHANFWLDRPLGVDAAVDKIHYFILQGIEHKA
jgi:AcrR family transcriptional regulator